MTDETNLPAEMPSTDDRAALAALMGAENDGPVNMLPRAKVNIRYIYESEDEVDEDGSPKEYRLPAGQIMINRDGEDIYAAKKAKVTFRPLINAYQNQKYDEDVENSDGSKGAFTCHSKIIKNWSEEMIDTNGGTRCGKIRYKDRDQATEAQLKESDKVNTFRYVYGLITFSKAHTATGEEREVKNQPVQFRLRGNNFMPFDDEFLKKIKRQNKLPAEFEIELHTEKRVNGETTFYVIHFDKWSMTKTVPVTQDVIAATMDFQKTIDFENEQVARKYKQVLSGQETSQDRADAKVIGESSDGDTSSTGLEDDLNDDIPF